MKRLQKENKLLRAENNELRRERDAYKSMAINSQIELFAAWHAQFEHHLRCISAQKMDCTPST